MAKAFSTLKVSSVFFITLHSLSIHKVNSNHRKHILEMSLNTVIQSKDVKQIFNIIIVKCGNSFYKRTVFKTCFMLLVPLSILPQFCSQSHKSGRCLKKPSVKLFIMTVRDLWQAGKHFQACGLKMPFVMHKYSTFKTNLFIVLRKNELLWLHFHTKA